MDFKVRCVGRHGSLDRVVRLPYVKVCLTQLTCFLPGHAIWIGNLPPQTDLMSLVHHVCKVAPGLESLFLISKSNCAFANFKDEPTCVDAQQKLHDSKFQSVRLVSRLRKSTVEGAGGATAPTGPSVTNPATSASNGEADSVSPSEPDSPNLSSTETPQPKANNGGMNGTQQDKFFVLKSLTAEDLELSVQTGIWATQSHNEETLNNAFKVSIIWNYLRIFNIRGT